MEQLRMIHRMEQIPEYTPVEGFALQPYAAGDEANDISMLLSAAEGFAPANCSAAVRSCGATIVSDAREHAMADIIAILDSRY